MSFEVRPCSLNRLNEETDLHQQAVDEHVIANQSRMIFLPGLRFEFGKNVAVNRTKTEVTFELFRTRSAYFHHKLLVLADVNCGGENFSLETRLVLRHTSTSAQVEDKRAQV